VKISFCLPKAQSPYHEIDILAIIVFAHQRNNDNMSRLQENNELTEQSLAFFLAQAYT
jgi:hypothetical protein